MESQSSVRGSEPTFDLQWDLSSSLIDGPADGDHDDCVCFSLIYVESAKDDPTIETLGAALLWQILLVAIAFLIGISVATKVAERVLKKFS